MPISNMREEQRQKRRYRIRKKIAGTQKRPRLVIFKSNRFVYAQLIDDQQGKTLAAVDSRSLKGKGVANATKIAQTLAESAQKKHIGQVVFDRGGYRYHGVVKAFSQAANQHGLKH